MYPTTRAELYAMYGVTEKTFNTWIKSNDVLKESFPKNKRRLTPSDVELVFKCIGKPKFTYGDTPAIMTHPL